MRERPFPRAVPSFRAPFPNFGIKKNSLTRADGGLWSSPYDDRYQSDDSFWNTLLLCGVLRLSRMRFVSFLKRFFSRVASRKLITVYVFFFFSLSFFPISQKLLNFEDTRAKTKDEEEKDQQQKSSSHALIKHNDSDKNNENARSSALPYLVVQKKVVLNLCALSAKETRRPPSFGTKTNEFLI